MHFISQEYVSSVKQESVEPKLEVFSEIDCFLFFFLLPFGLCVSLA